MSKHPYSSQCAYTDTLKDTLLPVCILTWTCHQLALFLIFVLVRLFFFPHMQTHTYTATWGPLVLRWGLELLLLFLRSIKFAHFELAYLCAFPSCISLKVRGQYSRPQATEQINRSVDIAFTFYLLIVNIVCLYQWWWPYSGDDRVGTLFARENSIWFNSDTERRVCKWLVVNTRHIQKSFWPLSPLCSHTLSVDGNLPGICFFTNYILIC